MAGGTLLGSLLVSLGLESAQFRKGMSEAERAMVVAQKKFQRVGSQMQGLGTKMAIGITAPFAALAVSSGKAAITARDAIGQVEATLASMGNGAGRSSEQVQALAKELEGISAYDDKEILREVSANMLTFGDIAGDNFDRANKAAVNLSAKLGTDLKGSAILVGKALNDPVKGLSALSRVGVKLAPEQEALAKSMAAAGDVAGAQAIILAELERQYNGSAQAVRDAAPGSDTINKWSDLQERLGEVALTFADKIVPVIDRVLSAFLRLSPGMQSAVIGVAAFAAAAGPVLIVAGSLVRAYGSLLPVLTKLGPAFKAVRVAAIALATSPPLLALTAIVGGIYLAWQNWDKIEPIIDSVKDAISGWWTGTVKPVFDKVIGAVKSVASFFADYFGGQIKDTIALVRALFTGDFAGAWEAAKSIARRAIEALGAIFGDLPAKAIESVRKLYNGVKTWLMDKLGSVFRWVGDKIETVKNGFFNLYDAVVGHSYIPDLVIGIRDWMAKLGPWMVDVATAATGKAAEKFKELRDLIDELFPERVRVRNFETGLSLIDDGVNAGQIGEDFAGELQSRLIDKSFPEIRSGLEAIASATRDAFGAVGGTIRQTFDDVGGAVAAAVVEASSKLTTLQVLAGAAFDELGRGLSDVLFRAKSLGDALRDILSKLADMAFNMAWSALGTQLGIPGFGGARAMGGPVSMGRTYLVGERGPELFTAARSGQIIPNHELRSGGRPMGAPANINITVHGAMNERQGRESAAMIARRVRQELNGVRQ